ncbi:phosphatidylserine decarboxylase domain-containing protein [Trichoderma velutinum]
MTILSHIHEIADYLLSWVKLIFWKQREQQTLWKKLELLVLLNPLMEWIDRTHLMRFYMYEESVAKRQRERTTTSRRCIKAFVDAYGINMHDFEPSNINRYPTFEDFFTRALKTASRPICNVDDPSHAVVVADSRVVVFNSIGEAKALWIKGKNFSLNDLVMSNELCDKFRHSAIASFRLSPQDYHRYHSPVQGTIQSFQSLPGNYYQVDPVALHNFIVIEMEEFWEVLFVVIGATDVGSVQIYKKYQRGGETVKKGDELGLFRIKFDDDLLGLSEQKIQTSVEVGMSLGCSM